jgi:N-acetylglucosamine kinase-like BadF-type ATPase
MSGDQRVEWILGIDGGGTKTTAWLATYEPAIPTLSHAIRRQGSGEAGPANPRSVGFDSAFANLDLSIARAFQDAGRARDRVASICICMAGVGRMEERRPIADWVRELGIAQRVRISEDVSPIRWAAQMEYGQSAAVHQGAMAQRMPVDTAWQRTVTLISGTGSIACAHDALGGALGGALDGASCSQDLRVGGWGYLLGDEGSGFAMGLAGLKEVCRAYDSGQSLTPFHRALLEALHCATPPELIPRVYTMPIPRPEIAALNRLVLEHAGGDPVAKRILEESAAELAQLVANAARRKGFRSEGYGLAMSGGNLGEHSPLATAVLLQLRGLSMEPMWSHRVQDPVLGALAMAAFHRAEEPCLA